LRNKHSKKVIEKKVIDQPGSRRAFFFREFASTSPHLSSANHAYKFLRALFLNLDAILPHLKLSRIASKCAHALQMQRNLHLFAGSAERSYPEKQSRKTSFR